MSSELLAKYSKKKVSSFDAPVYQTKRNPTSTNTFSNSGTTTIDSLLTGVHIADWGESYRSFKVTIATADAGIDTSSMSFFKESRTALNGGSDLTREQEIGLFANQMLKHNTPYSWVITTGGAMGMAQARAGTATVTGTVVTVGSVVTSAGTCYVTGSLRKTAIDISSSAYEVFCIPLLMFHGVFSVEDFPLLLCGSGVNWSVDLNTDAVALVSAGSATFTISEVNDHLKGYNLSPEKQAELFAMARSGGVQCVGETYKHNRDAIANTTGYKIFKVNHSVGSCKSILLFQRQTSTISNIAYHCLGDTIGRDNLASCVLVNDSKQYPISLVTATDGQTSTYRDMYYNFRASLGSAITDADSCVTYDDYVYTTVSAAGTTETVQGASFALGWDLSGYRSEKMGEEIWTGVPLNNCEIQLNYPDTAAVATVVDIFCLVDFSINLDGSNAVVSFF